MPSGVYPSEGWDWHDNNKRGNDKGRNEDWILGRGLRIGILIMLIEK